MICLGTVPASTTVYIPFTTYGGTNGESITCTGLAVTDIEIYKDGSVTQRASDAGYALLDTDGIDFDGITGLHGFSVDLSDNTDAGFFAVGSWYWVVVSAITVDSQTVSFLAATFRIGPAESATGYPKMDAQYVGGTSQTAVDIGDALAGLILVSTTIATLASQTSFTLTAGSADDDAYNGCCIIIEDVSTAAQKAIGFISDYTGSTKTVTLAADPGIFTMATTDKVRILARNASDVAQVTGTAVTGGTPDVNVTSWNGTSVKTPNTAGIPLVDIDALNGTALNGDGSATPWGP